MPAHRVLLIGAAAGVAFAFLDGILNANPLAQRLYAAYRPIARSSINIPAGLAIDLVAGIVMAFLFVRLLPVLPGGPIARGLAFGLLAWFFRVAMGVASQAVMFNVPGAMLVYSLFAGLVEMCALGLLYGLTLRPKQPRRSGVLAGP